MTNVVRLPEALLLTSVFFSRMLRRAHPMTVGAMCPETCKS